MMPHVYRIYRFSFRSLHSFRSFSTSLYPNTSANSFVFCPRLSLFAHSFHSCARKSCICHCYEKHPGVHPLGPRTSHVLLQLRCTCSPHPHSGAILFSRYVLETFGVL